LIFHCVEFLIEEVLAGIPDGCLPVSYLTFQQCFGLSGALCSKRNLFKEAVLERGIPSLRYTDNGKIYRSQQFEFICANFEGIGYKSLYVSTRICKITQLLIDIIA